MSTAAGIPPNISEITAPLLLGMLWNWALYGVLVVQVYVYSYNFPGDGRFIKILVYSVLLLETLQTTLSGADLYYWFVSGFGNMERLANPYASPYDTPMIGGAISMTVQLFFSYRIWLLGGKKAAWHSCAIICLLSIMGGVGAFFAGIQGAIRGKFPTGRILKLEMITWLMGNTLSDLLIATSMVYYLTRQAVNGNLLSDRAITMIVRLTVETNALTTIVGVTTLSMVAMFPDKNWFTCPVAVLGKLYSNTLLVTLNNRISIRDASESSIRTTPDPRFTIRPAHTAERFSLNRIGMTSSDDSESKIIDYRTALAI